MHGWGWLRLTLGMRCPKCLKHCHCLQVSTIVGGWVWEPELGLEPRHLLWDAVTFTSIFNSVLNTHSETISLLLSWGAAGRMILAQECSLRGSCSACQWNSLEEAHIKEPQSGLEFIILLRHLSRGGCFRSWWSHTSH